MSAMHACTPRRILTPSLTLTAAQPWPVQLLGLRQTLSSPEYKSQKKGTTEEILPSIIYSLSTSLEMRVVAGGEGSNLFAENSN